MEKINFQDLPSTNTPLNSTNLNQMQDNMEDAIIPIKLISISDIAPESATVGDMYYNTTDNKIYTATGTNMWDSGSTPRYDGFYVNTSNNTLFYYNGSTLIGVGGSGSGIGGDTLPVGMIMPGAFPSTLVVEDWLKCDGSAVSRTEYSELFNTIGVSYGSGDGSTTFNLPNIKGKMIIGYDPDDNDFDTMGATGGSKTHTQTVNEMPSHNHQLIGNNNTGNKAETVPYGSQLTGTSMYAVKATGGGQAMDIMNPYIVLNYYIKAHKTAPIYATVKNEETTSETDVYSCNYVNELPEIGIKLDNIERKTGRLILYNDNYYTEYVRKYNIDMVGSSNVNKAHELTDFLITKVEAIEYNPSSKVNFPLPSYRHTFLEHGMGLYVSPTDIVIEQNANAPDRTGHVAMVTLYYIKLNEFN